MRAKTSDIFLLFFRVGCTAFGAATSEILIRELTERRDWMRLEELKENMALVGLLPGPFHINLVMSLGHVLHGFRGQFAALLGFALPSFALAILLIGFLSFELPADFLREHPGILRGMLAAVTAMLGSAILKMGLGYREQPLELFCLPVLLVGLWFFKLAFGPAIVLGGILFVVLHIFARRSKRV